jgi:putative NIF3 family GTP cyclohydrolase 1 type 2
VLTATDVAAVFEEIAPRSLGLPDDELGFVFGDPAAPVRGVACMWNVHTGSLATVAGAGRVVATIRERMRADPGDGAAPAADG